MSSEYGRKITLTWDGTAIDGVREKSLSINGEPVNVTSDEDSGVRQLLSEDAEVSVDVELSGVTKSNVLRKAKLDGGAALNAPVVITYSSGESINGTFQLGNYGEGQPYNEATTFTATLMSTGTVNYNVPV